MVTFPRGWKDVETKENWDIYIYIYILPRLIKNLFVNNP